MTIVVDVQYALDDSADFLPKPEQFKLWISTALSGRRTDAEVSVRIVGMAEGAMLNETYRQRKGPTNVLAFPVDESMDLVLAFLGDLVICAPLVEQEAREQSKSPAAHWAHLTVHGTLHLLGYDHHEAREADVMEGLEAEILAKLGYADPYADEKETRTA